MMTNLKINSSLNNFKNKNNKELKKSESLLLQLWKGNFILAP